MRVPEHLSDEEAATLPCAALTAWSAWSRRRPRCGRHRPSPGHRRRLHLRPAIRKILGLRAILTSSSDEKLARARELGADEKINYRQTPEWGSRVKELTGGIGADLVVEVGGAGTLGQSLRAVRMGGTIALIGVLAGNALELPLPLIFMQRVRVQGILVGSREGFEAMNRAITSTASARSSTASSPGRDPRRPRSDGTGRSLRQDLHPSRRSRRRVRGSAPRLRSFL